MYTDVLRPNWLCTCGIPVDTRHILQVYAFTPMRLFASKAILLA